MDQNIIDQQVPEINNNILVPERAKILKNDIKDTSPQIIKNKMNDWYEWLVSHVPEPIKKRASETFTAMKNSVMSLTYKKVKPTKRFVDLTPKFHKHAMKKTFRTFRIAGDEKVGVNTYFKNVKNNIIKLLSENIKELGSSKVQMTLWTNWVQIETIEKIDSASNSKMIEAFQGSDLNDLFESMISTILYQFENSKLPSSKFKFEKILNLDINFHKLNLTRGNSYIPLPEWIAKKKAIINPKNEDEKCFQYAVIASLHHNEIKSHPERISSLQKFADNYDFSKLDFPVAINKIDLFENRNPEIAVNVLHVANKHFGILRRSKFVATRCKVVNLLLIVDEDGKKNHYTTIKSLTRLLSSENSKDEHAQYFCLNCLQGFTSKDKRDEHFQYCIDNDAVRVLMPTNNNLKYSDGQKQFKVPFVMYADFESILEKIDGCDGDPEKSFTRKVNKHTPSGYCLYTKFAYGKLKNPLSLYRGKDCVEKFVNDIEQQARQLYETIPQKPMEKLTREEWSTFNNSKVCHICEKDFEDEKGKRKVRDHCHYTGKYRGAAHSSCNLAYKIPSFMPVIFHNLSGYDSHLFIRELGKKFNTDEIECIAENKEKYISFGAKMNVALPEVFDKEGNQVYKNVTLRFLDSFRFMNSSLDKLSSNLSDENCKNLRKNFKKDKVFKLMRRKGVYPYEYMDDWGRFDETELPSKEAFSSKLNMSEISNEDYEHAQKVWDNISEKTLGHYHDLYLMTDVLLLADVFETFRDTCLEHYKLDPAQFYTSAGLAWTAALKYTRINLELLTDPDMLLMFEQGIRGGITQAVHRYAKANNKYMGEKYDPGKEDVYLQYLDANNLYGHAMSQSLPTGGFEWIKNNDQFTKDKILKLAHKKTKGYLLEVDVEYPKDLHDEHNDLPFMSEKMEINKVEKLVPNLNDKKKYIIHIKALAQALEHGLILKNVHRVIKFNQSPWLKEYIDFNTKLRTNAKNDFEKDFFKLMNNSVFGKTMENIRNHKNIKLITNHEKYLKYVMKPNFKSSIRFSENLIGLEMGKEKIVMNKPVYLGQAILDLSKLVIYEFHYDYIKPKYKDKVKLCYMDTDSFIYRIKTKDFYKDIANDVETRFDTSGYSKEEDVRPLPIGRNKKVIGLMKDELGGKIMTEFVALRPKLYAYKNIDGFVDKRCKGVKMCVVKKTISFDDYKNTLKTGNVLYRNQLQFRTDLHDVYTVNINKIALSRDDDKRIIQDDHVSTFARGHKTIS